MPRMLLSIVSLLLLSPLLVVAPAPAVAAAQPARPMFAFYYAWYDMNTWPSGKVADQPTAPYNSYERATIERHVGLARQAGLSGLILAWLGPNNPTDNNLNTLLSVTEGSDFLVSLYFETTSPFLQSRAAVVDALRRAMNFASHPNWVRYNGKPVIFFWRPSAVARGAGESAVAAWKALRQEVDPGHSTIWIGEGDDFSYLEAFDGIHPYSVAWSSDPAGTLAVYGQRTRAKAAALGTAKIWVPVAMPGYDDRRTGRGDAFVRDREDGRYYERTFNAAVGSQPDWAIIVNSFNEWAEGSMIEPSVSYGDKYINLTRGFADKYRNYSPGGIVPVPVANPAPASAQEFSIPGGYFFRQTGPGDGRGYSVTNADGAMFWNEFQRLGGVARLGYPMSRRFNWDGFTTQVFQKAVLQWRPDVGKAYFVNVFDQMSLANKDGWLEGGMNTPRPLDGSFDAGKSWEQVVAGRVALLNANPAIRQMYNSVGDPMTFYGLPTSTVVDNGNHYAVRLQRAVIQQWKVDVPWAKAGQATVANGGDVAVQAGMFGGEILAPESP